EEGRGALYDRFLCPRIQRGHLHPLVGDDPIVLKRPGQMALIAGMDSPFGHRRIDDLVVDYRLGVLILAHARDEVGAGVDAIVEGSQTRVRPRVDFVWLSAVNHRGYRYPSLGDEAVDGAMMTIELPSPESPDIGSAVDGEVV